MNVTKISLSVDFQLSFPKTYKIMPNKHDSLTLKVSKIVLLVFSWGVIFSFTFVWEAISNYRSYKQWLVPPPPPPVLPSPPVVEPPLLSPPQEVVKPGKIKNFFLTNNSFTVRACRYSYFTAKEFAMNNKELATAIGSIGAFMVLKKYYPTPVTSMITDFVPENSKNILLRGVEYLNYPSSKICDLNSYISSLPWRYYWLSLIPFSIPISEGKKLPLPPMKLVVMGACHSLQVDNIAIGFIIRKTMSLAFFALGVNK